MDTEIKDKILNKLFNKQGECDLTEIATFIVQTMKTGDSINWGSIKDKTYQVLLVMKDHDLVEERINSEDRRNPIFWYRLSANGYKEFDPWYKKFWCFLNDDFAKLLSLIAIILSITATVISIIK